MSWIRRAPGPGGATRTDRLTVRAALRVSVLDHHQTSSSHRPGSDTVTSDHSGYLAYYVLPVPLDTHQPAGQTQTFTVTQSILYGPSGG